MNISSDPIIFFAVFFAAFLIVAGMLLLVGLGISRCCSKPPSQLEQKELSQELGGEHWIMGQRQSIVFTPFSAPPPYSANLHAPSPNITDVVDTTTIQDPLTAINLDNAAEIIHAYGFPTSCTGHAAHHLTPPPPAVVGWPFADVTALDRSWEHRLTM